VIRGARVPGLLGLAFAAALAGVAGCGRQPAAGPPAPPAILRVAVGQGPAAAVATGFAGGDGRVITVQHVLGTQRAVSVGAPRGPVRRGTVLRSDARADLAVLAVAGLRAPALRRASAGAGDAITVLVWRDGRVRALHGRVRRVITARVRTTTGTGPQVRPGLELTAPIRKGDSGAPVLDAEARVVGIVFAQAGDRDGLAYAVASSALP
jgi:S1-C subfamily serine protease